MDVERHNRQYPPVDVREIPAVYDRFLLLDGTHLYTFGASFKDLGKKLFCFSLMESGAVVAAVRGMVVFGGVDVNLRNITNQRRCRNSPTPVREFANAGAGIRQRRCRNLPTPMREWSNARTGMNQRVYYDSFIQVVAYLSIVQIAKFCVSTDGTYVILWIMLRVSDTLVHEYRSHTPHGTSLRLFRVGLLK